MMTAMSESVQRKGLQYEEYKDKNGGGENEDEANLNFKFDSSNKIQRQLHPASIILSMVG